MESYGYDANGRLAGVTGGGRDMTVSYAAGHVHVTDGVETLEYDLDGAGRVVAVQAGADAAIRAERDGAGDIVRLSQRGRSMSLDRDALGRIVHSTFAVGDSARYFYDELGHRTLAEYGDGGSALYEFDAAGNVTGFEVFARDGTRESRAVTVDTARPVERTAYDGTAMLEVEYERVEYGTVAVAERDREPSTSNAAQVPDTAAWHTRRVVFHGDEEWGSQPDYGVVMFTDDLRVVAAQPLRLGVPGSSDAGGMVEAASMLGEDAAEQAAVPRLQVALALVDVAAPLFTPSGPREFERPSNGVFEAPETRIVERAFAAGSRTPNADEESANCLPPTVSVDSADVVSDEIVVTLQPTGVSGTLEVSLVGMPAHTVSTSTVTGGTHMISFGIGSVPTGNYTGVRATWTVGTDMPTDTRAYGFRVLGSYRHSRYNTPSEANCTGTPQSSYVTNNQCTFTPTMLNSGFVSQVNLNGSGYSTNHGTVARENWCLDSDNHEAEIPDDAEERSFRSGHTVVGSCGAVGNATVAVAPGHDHLSCGDLVYIVGVGVKTVTDRCPACTSEQLDNYTTNTDCHRILDLGTYKTIEL